MTEQEQQNDAAVQNRFTAYIVKALRNFKADYYSSQLKISSSEILFSEPPDELKFSYVSDFETEGNWEKIEDYIGDEKLLTALRQLSDSESIIIFMRMVRQMGPTEIANQLNKNVFAVNKMYYRAISKLRKELGSLPPRGGEKKNEFYGGDNGSKIE